MPLLLVATPCFGIVICFGLNVPFPFCAPTAEVAPFGWAGSGGEILTVTPLDSIIDCFLFSVAMLLPLIETF